MSVVVAACAARMPDAERPTNNAVTDTTEITTIAISIRLIGTLPSRWEHRAGRPWAPRTSKGGNSGGTLSISHRSRRCERIGKDLEALLDGIATWRFAQQPGHVTGGRKHRSATEPDNRTANCIYAHKLTMPQPVVRVSPFPRPQT